MCCWSLILAHSAYFLSVPNCGDPALKLGLVIFSCMVLVIFPYDWMEADKISMERRTAYLASKANNIKSPRRVSLLKYQCQVFSTSVDGQISDGNKSNQHLGESKQV